MNVTLQQDWSLVEIALVSNEYAVFLALAIFWDKDLACVT